MGYESEGMSRVKSAEEVRGSYMTFGDVIDREKQESYEQGIEQGIEQGRAQGIEHMIMQMFAMGRSVDEIADFTGYDEKVIVEVANKGR